MQLAILPIFSVPIFPFNVWIFLPSFLLIFHLLITLTTHSLHVYIETCKYSRKITLCGDIVFPYCKFGRGFYFRETSRMRSFAKIESSQNGEIKLSFTDIVKSCPSREFLAFQICYLRLFAKIKFSRKISGFTVSYKGLLFKERLSSPNFEKQCNWGKSLLVSVVSLWCVDMSHLNF